MSRKIRVRGLAPGGAAAVEFALILPVLLLCILGLIELGRMVWTQATLDYAVEAAARCRAIDQTHCPTEAATQQFAIDNFMLPPDASFQVPLASCGYQATATLSFVSVVPELLPYSQTLTASACFPT